MKPLLRATVDAYLAGHYGVIARRRAIELGMTPRQIHWELATGTWSALYRGVYLAASHPAGPAARLAAACQVAGADAVASHQSAAWLWTLIPAAPARPVVSIPSRNANRRPGITAYRRPDLDAERILVHQAIPVTDPLRTIVDLGAVLVDGDLDDAIDRALARRLVTVPAIEAELDRLGRRGRMGVPAVRGALARRGLVQAPTASVLESRTLRLLRQWGIEPVGVEVVAAGGAYRVDFLLRPGLVLEVDGYAFHWSPEAKAADSRRRNRLAQGGIRVIEADWVTVMRHPEQLRRTIESALDLAPRSLDRVREA